MRKSPSELDALFKHACIDLDAVHDAINDTDLKEQIGRTIRAILEPKDLLDAHQLTQLNLALTELKQQGWLWTRHYRSSLLSAITAVDTLCQLRQSNSTVTTVYPSGPNGVQTQAYVKWREHNEAQLIEKGHPVLRDVNRSTQVLGQSHTNFQADGSSLERLLPILKELDFVCGISEEQIKPLYTAAMLLYEATETCDYRLAKNPLTCKNNLQSLAISMLLDDKNTLATSEKSFLGFLVREQVDKAPIAALNNLIEARKAFESNHPELSLLRRFALSGAGQHISNDLYLISTHGNEEEGVLPTITIDGNPQFMKGSFEHNITRRGQLQCLASDDDDVIVAELDSAKPGTYLVVQNQSNFTLHYKGSTQTPTNIAIDEVEGLTTFTENIEENRIESLPPLKHYQLEQLLGAYHEHSRRPEGDLVVTVHGTINEFVHAGEFHCLEPKTGTLVGPMDPEEANQFEGMIDACTVDLQLRVIANQGELKPVLTDQIVVLNSSDIEHTPHMAIERELDNTVELAQADHTVNRESKKK